MQHAVCSPRFGSAEESITIAKRIAAIAVGLNAEGKIQIGVISQLPDGACLEVCGEGFNERTIKVRWREQFYYVFLQDVELPESLAVYA